MAGKTQERIAETGPSETSPPREGGEEKPVEAADGERSPRKGRMGAGIARFLSGRRVLFAAAALLLVGLGGWAFPPAQIGRDKGPKQSSATLSGSEGPEDKLRQEDLERFYIPLRGPGPAQLLVVDFSVVWDPISAVRYRNGEVSLRDRLYDRLTALAAKVEELGENPRLIEDEMGRVFRERLRTETLSVKVREVKVF